jgi:hypothetical protein
VFRYAGIPEFLDYIFVMSKVAKPRTPAKTPAPRSRAEKARPVNLEAEGVLLTDYERDDSAVRKNLERLRTQRLAREAEATQKAPSAPKKLKVPKDTRTTAQKFADYVAAQRQSART